MLRIIFMDVIKGFDELVNLYLIIFGKVRKIGRLSIIVFVSMFLIFIVIKIGILV